MKYIIELMSIFHGPLPLRLLSSPRRRIVAFLRLDDRTVAELARELTVSTNAVRSHLTALERDGVVDRGGVRRESVGKPARIYRLSTAGEELFARAYAPMLLAFLDLLREWDGPEGLTEVLSAVGARLGAGATGRGPAGAVEALRALDADVTSDRGDERVMLVVSGCPLAAAVAERPGLCDLMTAFVSGAAGSAASERCDRAGARPRCRFAFSDPATCAQR